MFAWIRSYFRFRFGYKPFHYFVMSHAGPGMIEDLARHYSNKGTKYLNERVGLFNKTLGEASTGSEGGVVLYPTPSLLAFANFSTAVQHAETVKGRSYPGRGISTLFLFYDTLGDPDFMRSFVESVERFNSYLSKDTLRWWREIMGENFQELSKAEALDRAYRSALKDLKQADGELFQGTLNDFRKTMQTIKTLTEYFQERDWKEDYKQGKFRF